MPTKINGNRRISPASIGAALFDNSVIDGAGKILTSLLPASILGALSYQGTLDASTGTYPTAPAKGYYYVVSVAGVISGVDYQVGDWATFNGTSWEKVDSSDKVSSVNGKVGAVVLNTDDVSEGSTNQYFTDARAKAASVVDSTVGSETDKAPSVSATKALVASLQRMYIGATTMSGTVDGTNKVFTLASPTNTQYLTYSLTVYVGRVVLAETEYSASESAGVLTVTLGSGVDAPVTGEDVLVSGSVLY